MDHDRIRIATNIDVVQAARQRDVDRLLQVVNDLDESHHTAATSVASAASNLKGMNDDTLWQIVASSQLSYHVLFNNCTFFLVQTT